jgi:hypothetical protein
MDFISTYKPQDTIFGIANVESQSCSQTIAYYLGERMLTLLVPEACMSCRKASNCTKEFGEQIVYKYNQRHKGAEIYFPF